MGNFFSQPNRGGWGPPRQYSNFGEKMDSKYFQKRIEGTKQDILKYQAFRRRALQGEASRSFESEMNMARDWLGTFSGIENKNKIPRGMLKQLYIKYIDTSISGLRETIADDERTMAELLTKERANQSKRVAITQTSRKKAVSRAPSRGTQRTQSRTQRR